MQLHGVAFMRKTGVYFKMNVSDCRNDTRRHACFLGSNQHTRERFMRCRASLLIIELVPTINMYETSGHSICCSTLNQSLIRSACLSDFQFSSALLALVRCYFSHVLGKALEAEKSAARFKRAMRDVYNHTRPTPIMSFRWLVVAGERKRYVRFISQPLLVQLISLSGGSTPAAADAALFTRLTLSG